MELIKTNKKTICLTTMVKNEEKVIGRMIDSCKEIIDYWVIQDTGSTDKTIEIIREKLKDIPGDLIEIPFVNFGQNRTQLVKKAKDKADYLLLLDADMTIGCSKKFDKTKLFANAYHIRYSGSLDFAQTLLVSGHLDWFYEGVTHEYITCGTIENPPIYEELWVNHLLDGFNRPEKLERDKTLLEKDIINNPGNSRSYFYLAQTYANMSMYDQAIKYYKERIARGGWSEEVYYSRYQIGVILYALKKPVDSKLALLDGYEFRPSRFECLYMLGYICREMKQYNQAKLYFEAVKNTPYPKNDLLFIHKNQYDYLTDFELGIVYFWLNDYKKSERQTKMVLDRKDVPKSIREQAEKNLAFAQDKLGKRKDGKRDFIVASMFTQGTEYEIEVQKLKEGLDKFKLKYEIIGIKSQGSWEKNTQMKPEVIKAVMEKYKLPVVWMDADAELLKYPEFFHTITGDVSYYKIEQWNEMLTGTLYFADVPECMKFLDKWIALNNENNLPDAKNFQTIMLQERELRYVPLPADYIKIFDNTLIESKDPVIRHNQASRRLRNNIVVEHEDIVRTILNGMKNGQDTCSIIGNGPFVTDLSGLIDKSFVMRCNDFKLGEQYKEIGTKVNLNISSLFYEILPDRKVDYPIFGILPISDTMYQRYTSAKMMHSYWQENAVKLVQMGNTVITYDDEDRFSEVFMDVAEKINAFPTVGIMAIATARWLRYKKIIISGFTFFETPKSHYFKEQVVHPSMHHNVKAEKMLLRNWINERDGTEYILDELTQKALDNVTT